MMVLRFVRLVVVLASVFFATADAAPEVTRYTYTLDARGNWTKRVADTTLADGKGSRRIRITYRRLDYY